jgi:hypothetical protein
VIVLESGLVIHKIYNGYSFFGQPTREDLREDLRAVSKKCRPDWDITTLQLKAACPQGRKELRTTKPMSKLSANRIGSAHAEAAPGQDRRFHDDRVLLCDLLTPSNGKQSPIERSDRR